MKLNRPDGDELEMVDAFSRSLEQKKDQLRLKRNRSVVEDDDDSIEGEPIRDGSVDTTPEETPRSPTKRLFSCISDTQHEPPTTCEFILESRPQDSVEDEAPTKQIPTPNLFLGTSTTNACSMQRTELEAEEVDSPEDHSLDQHVEEDDQKWKEFIGIFMNFD